ncbi:hypothetical protein DYU05_16320 [Mucilaginibacter terrenus]|uniref:Uncharacterized protein n=1 Tax=Mucilaginibacter terrenus TaxID=2482727 RepID=A0A3E2NMF3_9SPHI|nr:hypothetical protein [Mucilaginibacter terrenus]RFZ82184.1 hypothetical protein DYU05_16320 [Mucilaginibacter terrenus]
MKYLKVFAIAIITLFAVEGAKAQVAVHARIGAPVRSRTVVVERPVYHRPYYRRAVAVRPVYHRPYRRTVVVERPAYRRHVVYNRPYAKRVVVRRY